MAKTITIKLKDNRDRSYAIRFGLNIQGIAKDIASYHSGSAFIITDSNVAQLYGDALLQELGKRSIRVEQIVIPAGEQSKNRRMKERIEDHLIALHADRQSLIIALGGGVVGDFAGFIAATLFRGVPFVQIPTSLLAQVDSSVGGKVAVDHPLGKNLIGAFYQPLKVYIDAGMLRTLPKVEFRCGLAEVIKCAAIMDASLFSLLEKKRKEILRQEKPVLEHIIARCCKHKGDIVERDERDSGLRRILNFGHTIGHSVESMSDYSIRHGEAVSIGMATEAELSVAAGILAPTAKERLVRLLSDYSLPVTIPSTQELEEIIRRTQRDKKLKDGIVQYTLLRRIGEAVIGVGLTAPQALAALTRLSS